MQIKVIFNIILMAVIIASPVCAYAYRINTEDLGAYSFKNGEFRGQDDKYRCIYEVDEDAGTITEISVINAEDSGREKVDLVNLTTPETYKIVANNENGIVGIKTRPEGESVLSFKKDGTYHYYLTGYVNNEVLSGMSFGTFTVSKNLPEKFLFLEPIQKLIDDNKANDLEAQVVISNLSISKDIIAQTRENLQKTVKYPSIVDALINYLEVVSQEGDVRAALSELKAVVNRYPDFNILTVGQADTVSALDSIR